jgi:hypothetical protein
MRFLTAILSALSFGCSPQDEIQTWNYHHVGLTAPRHDMLGYHISRLPLRESDLASASYMFQGRPDAVISDDFGYHSVVPWKCEDYLLGVLNPAVNERNSLSEGITFLASRLFMNRSWKPVLVLAEPQREPFQARIKADIGSFKPSSMDRLLADTMLFWLSFHRDSKQANGYLAQIHSHQEAPWVCVYQNLLNVSKQMRTGNTVRKGWERPMMVR